MATLTPRPAYYAYLIRMWTARENGEVVWRASLENPHNGERLAFASLQRLFAFLQDQTAACDDHSEQE